MKKAIVILVILALVAGAIICVVQGIGSVHQARNSGQGGALTVASAFGQMSGEIVFLAIPGVLCLVSLGVKIHKILAICLNCVVLILSLALLTQPAFISGILFLASGILGIIVAARTKKSRSNQPTQNE